MSDSKTELVCVVKEHLNRRALYLVLLIGICLIPFALAQRTTWRAPANIITVTNLNDSGPGSLRQALADANDGDTIDFAVAGTIESIGELLFAKNIIISGPSAETLAVNGDGNSPVFHIGLGETVTISGLTITNGRSGILNEEATLSLTNCVVGPNNGDTGSGIYNKGVSAMLTIVNSSVTSNFNNGGGSGGGIYNESGIVTIANSMVTKNVAALVPNPIGGGIVNGGVLDITDSTISDNFAGYVAGGILNWGTLTVTNSTVSGNQTGTNVGGNGFGGGIYNYPGGTVTITSSSITENNANGKEPSGWGAGIGNEGSLDISNSTVSGNRAGQDGGGIYNFGPLHITNTTISDNWADLLGGGIYNGATGMVDLGNTILNAGGSGANISNNGGNITSHGYNLSSDDGGGNLTGPGDQINTDPMIGPLQDNGGPTFTHALLPGSPAINTGDPNFTPPPLYDQRSSPFVRVFNGRIDIGSLEVQPPRRPAPTARPRPTPVPRP